MSHFFSDAQVWDQIASISSNCVRKKAAVSYVSSDSILKFASNDLLVLDASIETVRQGGTSASVIKRAMSRGAEVVSVAALHGKVMLFDETAIVGSANISVRSTKLLREAVSLHTDTSFLQAANRWIDTLVREGELIDESQLNRLLEIEAERAPIQRSLIELAETHIVFFKQVLPGDIEKYKTSSSTAGSGGGARDLRVSQVELFRPLLSQMISEPSGDQRFTQATVHSRSRGNDVETLVELWRPTAARPNEMRISRIYSIPGWAVDEAEYEQNNTHGIAMFYVLEMDVHGTLTAKVLTERKLTQEHEGIAELIANLRERDGERFAITGAADVINRTFIG